MGNDQITADPADLADENFIVQICICPPFCFHLTRFLVGCVLAHRRIVVWAEWLEPTGRTGYDAGLCAE